MPSTPPNPKFKTPLPPGAVRGTVKARNPKAGGAQIAADPGSPCLISYPSASVPLVGTVGGGCILSKTNIRAMVGGLLIGAGGILFLGGAVVLVAAGFKKPVGKLASAIPGPGAQIVGAVAQGNPGGIRSGVTSGARRRRAGAAEDARLERAMGEPRENTSLRTGRGAVRETPAGTRRRKASGSDEPPF